MTQVELSEAVEKELSGKSLAELKTIKAESDKRGWTEVSVVAAMMIQGREGYKMDEAKRTEQEAIVAKLMAEMGI